MLQLLHGRVERLYDAMLRSERVLQLQLGVHQMYEQLSWILSRSLKDQLQNWCQQRSGLCFSFSSELPSSPPTQEQPTQTQAPESMGGFLEIGAGNLWTLLYRITAMKLYSAIYLNVVKQLNCTNVVAVRGIIFFSHEIVFIYLKK